MAKKGGASTEKKAADKKSGGKNASATKNDESADKKVNIFQNSPCNHAQSVEQGEVAI